MTARGILILLLCAASSLTPAAAWAQGLEGEKKEFITAEELLQTEAGKLFALRRWAEALEAFRKLARDYPQDVVPRRYIGACLDHLKRDDEAIEAFREALRMAPKDLVSRQFVAKIYIRKGDLDRAEEELRFLVENDKKGTYKGWAEGQLEAIKKLREAAAKFKPAPGLEISPQEFLKTEAAQLFMRANFAQALDALTELEKRYPDDILIKRYKSLALDRLGRVDEAARVLQSALTRFPGSVSLRYFLAQTLTHKRDFEGAKREYRYVVEHDETGVYKARAQAELLQVERAIGLLKAAKLKKWSVSGSAGVEWLSNPTSNTRVDALKTTTDISSWKFSNTAGASYQFLRRGPWTLKGTYSYSHALYSDSLSNLSTVGNSWGLNGTYVKSIRGKPFLAQIGHSTSHTMLRTKFYSVAFSESLTLLYSFTDWYRLTLSEKWTFTQYDSDGSAPDSTGRDGFGNVVGLTNNFYFNKAKTFSALLGLDYGEDDTQGINYVKDEFTYRTGLHFPIRWKWDGDLSFKFKDSQYPKYGFPTTSPGRHDLQYALGATLSRPLGKYWTLSSSYNYTDNNSRDDNFTYANHTYNLTLSVSY